MKPVVDSVSALFGGGGAGLAAQQAAQQRDMQTIAQQREAQTLQEGNQKTDAQLAAGGRPRGSRLLLSKEDSGLAQTLGTAS